MTGAFASNTRCSAAEKRFSLGAVYVPDEVDAHGGMMTADEVELMAWRALAKGLASGLDRADGTVGSGTIVESHIHRGAPMKLGDETIQPGMWMIGVVSSPDAWDRIGWLARIRAPSRSKSQLVGDL